VVYATLPRVTQGVARLVEPAGGATKPMKRTDKKNKASSNRGSDMRQRAEDRLRLETMTPDDMPEGEVAALVHELRVHKVELEMQNESLRQAQVEVEQSRAKYADLFDFAPVGYFVFDRRGAIVEANLTAAGMLHVERGRLIGQGFSTFLRPPSRDAWQLHRHAVFESGKPQRCELDLKGTDKTPMAVRLRSQPVTNGQGQVIQCRTAMTDITEIQAAEDALRQAHDGLEKRVAERTAQLNDAVGTLQEEVAEKLEAQNLLMRQNDTLQKIIGGIPVMLCFYDAQGNVAMVNKEFERVLGYSMKDVEKSSLLELCCPDAAQRQEFWQFMSSGEPGWRDFLVQRKRGGKVVSSWANVRLADGSYVGIGIDIRERRRFENRLRESEQRYRTLVELSPDAICVERDGTILFVNSTAVKLAGAEKAEDLVGRQVMDFVHPDYAKQAQKKLATIRRERAPLPAVEQKIVRLDGGVLDVEAAGMPIPFEGGPAIQIVIHDITERKRAEERLRRSAWQLQQQAELLDLAHDTIMVHDMDGRITFWNQGAEQTYGWTRQEALGAVSHELLKTRFPHDLIEITTKLLEQGRWDGELTHTTRSGEAIIVSSRWALQRDENGQPAAILVIDRDITQQKKAERAMSEARRFAESVIDTVQEALLVLDADLRVISANHTFYDTFQILPEQTKGQYVYDIGNRQWDIPELRRLLEDILPHNTSFENFEVEHDFEHIGHRTMLLNARRIYHENQETEMILLAMLDVTIRKQQEQEIREHQQQLASLSEQLLLAEERERHRLAETLHDSIGQSLSFSKRELGVLQKRAPVDLMEGIEDVKKEIDLAIQQTRDLTFELSPTTLHTFGLEAAIEELGDQFARREEFTYHFKATEDDKPLTEQIKTLLYRAVRELLLNVAKHACAKNVSVNIDRIEDKIRIRVADDGRGFDVSALEQAGQERLGFGIFSIRERLTHVGGSFHVTSQPGKGTEAVLIAPLDTTK
jgi:PAS domain S-box-containing protein